MSFFKKTLTMLAMATVVSCEYYHHEDDGGHHGVGYSYAKFSGPVSGPEHKIVVDDKHGHGHSYDFVAKPDYHFEYGVEDPKSRVSQNRKEHRHGDVLHGDLRIRLYQPKEQPNSKPFQNFEFSVVEPDGKIRQVKYTADKHNGFQAEVLIDGKPLHYDALQEQKQHLLHQQQQLEQLHETAGHQGGAGTGSGGGGGGQIYDTGDEGGSEEDGTYY